MPNPISDPHAPLRHEVLHTVLDGPAETDPALRRQAAEGVGVPVGLQTLVEKIHRHAYKVTDEEIAALQDAYGEDPLFEIIVSASVGASEQRLVAALKALEEA